MQVEGENDAYASFFNLEDKAEIKTFVNIQSEESLPVRIETFFYETITQFHSERQLTVPLEVLLPVVKASLVIVNLDHVYNSFHLRNGIIRALFFQETKQMVTKSLETEIHYQLAPTTSINSAVKLFSVNESIPTSNFALVRLFGANTEENELSAIAREISQLLFAKIATTFKENEIAVDAIESHLMAEEKVERIKKLFKLNKDERDVIGAIVSKVAVKDHLN